MLIFLLWLKIPSHTHICIYIYICVCVCVCVFFYYPAVSLTITHLSNYFLYQFWPAKKTVRVVTESRTRACLPPKGQIIKKFRKRWQKVVSRVFLSSDYNLTYRILELQYIYKHDQAIYTINFGCQELANAGDGWWNIRVFATPQPLSPSISLRPKPSQSSMVMKTS